LKNRYIIGGFAVAALFAASVGFSQIPRTISYQGLLISPGGIPIADAKHVITINLYDAFNASTAIYTDAESADTKNGLFNIIIGGVAPIPGTIDFSKQYWLGVSVDGGAEMSPRTALTSVPYALHAEVADRVSYIDANAKGVVTSVNELDGPIRIIGDSTTRVTMSGSVLTISALPDGVQTIQNVDGTISIVNPNGPIVTLGINDTSISNRKLARDAVSTDKIQDGAVTGAKINQMGALTNQVLKWDGTKWSPGKDDTTAIKAGTGVVITTDANGNNVISTTLIGLPPGTNGATLRFDGPSNSWIANTFLYNDGASIGIGTTTPSAMLDMAGNFMISNSGNVSNELRIQEPLSTGPAKHYTSFRAVPQPSTISYQLPPALQPGVALLSVDNQGVMNWVNVIPNSVWVPFTQVTSGYNSKQDLQVGDGSYLHPMGTGIIAANQLTGSSSGGSSYAGRIPVPQGTTSLTVNLNPSVGCSPNSSVTVSQFDSEGFDIIVGTMVTAIQKDAFTIQFSASYPTTTGFITYLVVNP
jgi:hypothetical protein